MTSSWSGHSIAAGDGYPPNSDLSDDDSAGKEEGGDGVSEPLLSQNSHRVSPGRGEQVDEFLQRRAAAARRGGRDRGRSPPRDGDSRDRDDLPAAPSFSDQEDECSQRRPASDRRGAQQEALLLVLLQLQLKQQLQHELFIELMLSFTQKGLKEAWGIWAWQTRQGPGAELRCGWAWQTRKRGERLARA